jgi:hypothetical protein
MIEVPLPIPHSVIRSPSHRSIIVPAVIKAIAGKTTPQKLVVSMIGAAPPVPTIVFKRRIIP